MNATWEKYVTNRKEKKGGWVKMGFTIKYKAKGSIERYKSRLVANKYTQTYDIDYLEIFTPVAKIDTIRVQFSIATSKDWPLHQFSVKNVFLHWELMKEVYIEVPPGFSDEFQKNGLCKLREAFYGLKQSPHA